VAQGARGDPDGPGNQDAWPNGQKVRLASYDARLTAAAAAIGIEAVGLD